MQEPSKPSDTTDELNTEFDAIVTKEQSSVREAEVLNEIAGPVIVQKREVSESARPEPVATATSESTVPVAGPAVTPVVSERINTPGSLILQWLTYAFWGWYALAMIWLVGVVIQWLVDREGLIGNVGDILPYPMAASIILLFMALGADFFYSRIEPAKKYGEASTLMIFHAVIFALFGIGALISAVFAVIYTLLNAGVFGGANGSKVIMITAFIMMVVYILLTLRTVFGATKKVFKLAAWGTLSALLVGIVVVGIVGPVSGAMATKQDRLIENELPGVVSSIEQFVVAQNKLPADLSEAMNASDAYQTEGMKELISQNLVRYTPDTKPASIPERTNAPDDTMSEEGVSSEFYADPAIRYYRLCVTYKQVKKGSYSNYVTSPKEKDLTSIETDSHGSGEQCYDMKVESENLTPRN